MESGVGSSEVDIWRDTPVRLLGYANEVVRLYSYVLCILGESFRALVHQNVVRASYAVAFGYCLADTADKTMKMAQKPGVSQGRVVSTAADTLLWQTLASVAIPGFTINRICSLSLFLLARAKLNPTAAKWTTTAIGLGSIPLIYKPIDHFVDKLMDKTYREWTK